MNNRAKFKQKHWIFGAVALVLLLVFIYPSAGKLVLSSTWGLLASVGIIPESGSQTLEVDALTVSNQLTVGGIVSFGGITYNWPTTQPQSNQVLTVNSINGDIVNLYWGTVDGTGGGGGGGGGGGTFTCGDNLLYFGQTYATVEIGSQCWMQENLNVGTCVTGTTEQASAGIATRAGCDGSDVNQVQIEKYCYDNNENNCYSDDGDDSNDYGGLYQWDEAMDYSNIVGAQGICPEDWHIPTDAEWYTLESGLTEPGESCDADRKGVLGWACNPAGTELTSTASNSFKGLLAGYRHTYGSFHYLGTYGLFWSSLESGSSAWYRTLYSSYATVRRNAPSKAYGFSLRCVKDRTTGGGGEDGGGNDGGGEDGGGNDGGGNDGGGEDGGGEDGGGNTPPVFDEVEDFVGDRAVTSGRLVSFTVSASDVDGDELFYFASIPMGGAGEADFDPDTGRFNWTPSMAVEEKEMSVRFRVSDNQGGEDIMEVKIDVIGNRAPIFTNPNENITTEIVTGETFSVNLGAFDANGDDLTYSVLDMSSLPSGTLPSGAVLDSSSGEFTWTPSVSQVRDVYYRFRFSVSDGEFADGVFIIVGVVLSQTACEGLPYGGQTYQTVSINGECWMAENLNFGEFDNFSNLRLGSTIQKLCYNNTNSYCDPENPAYTGALYSWSEAVNYTGDVDGWDICPVGWHIPTKSEYEAVKNELPFDSSSFGGSGVWNGSREYWNGVGNFARLWTKSFSDSNSNKIHVFNALRNGNHVWTLEPWGDYSDVSVASVRCVRD